MTSPSASSDARVQVIWVFTGPGGAAW